MEVTSSAYLSFLSHALNSYVQRQDLTLLYHFFEILRTAGPHQPDRCVGTAIFWELQILSQRNSCVWCSEMHM